MKRRIICAALIAALLLALAVPALTAGESPTESPGSAGMYNVEAAGTLVELHPQNAEAEAGEYIASDNSVKIDGEAVEFYPNAVKLEVTYNGATNGHYYLVLAQTDQKLPTAGNITYIDQETASGTSVSFTVYPSRLNSEGTNYIYLADADAGYRKVGSFSYFAPESDSPITALAGYTLSEDAAGNETLTAGKTTITVAAPERGWREGENVFTVASTDDIACVVVWYDSASDTYFRISADTAVTSAHSYKVVLAASDELYVSVSGDVGGTGSVEVSDYSELVKVYKGERALDEIHTIIGNVSKTGRIEVQDYSELVKVYKRERTLEW